MGQPGAFLKVDRRDHTTRPSEQTVNDFDDFVVDLLPDEQREQASRCMNCGVAFCQSGVAFPGAKQPTGCPLHNLIPETNDLLYRGRWDDAAARLALTNPFPEFTGRVCPAPCETACNLGLHDAPVTIHDDERAISDYAWKRGIAPLQHAPAGAPRASVVGSGPAGLTVAWELARRGFSVRVYERDDRPGGLLTYGIPNMKLPKQIVERRVKLMKESGIEFCCGVDAADQAAEICAESDAVVLAVGARQPRVLDLLGTDYAGIHYAVDYLTEVTSALLDGREPAISAEGKDVVVIGGGDTGIDCVATALRQGAASVRQVIRARRPHAVANATLVWPAPRSSDTLGYGQREALDVLGVDPRMFCTDVTEFVGNDGAVCAVTVHDLSYEGGMHALAGTDRDLPAQLVLIAKGFIGPEQRVMDAFKPYNNVSVAGDARMGSTLVATAIADGLDVARRIAHQAMR